MKGLRFGLISPQERLYRQCKHFGYARCSFPMQHVLCGMKPDLVK